MKFNRTIIIAVLIFCIIQASYSVPCEAWSADGHMVITTAACKFLPPPWKQLFQYYGWLLNETSLYPDSYRETDPNEGPRHYIDLEVWNPNRPETGTLPQAVEEFTARMEQSIQAGDWNEMFLHAGRLAHYMADLAQPYHTTVNYDPLTRDGRGLHQVLDSSIAEHLSEIRLLSPSDAKILTPIANLTRFVLDMAVQSHSFLPIINETLIDKGLSWSPELTAIIENRTNTAVIGVARVWYTAIVRSNSLPPDLPKANKLSVVVENMTLNKNDMSIIRVHVVDSLGVKTYAQVVLNLDGSSYRAQVANVVPPLGEYMIILGPGIHEGTFVFVAERIGYSSGTTMTTVTSIAQITNNSSRTSSTVLVTPQNPYLPIIEVALLVLLLDIVFVLWYYRRSRTKRILAVGILVAVIAVSIALFPYMSPFGTVPSQITTQMRTSTTSAFNVETTYQTYSTSTSAIASSVQKLKWVSSSSNVISWTDASNNVGQTKTVEGTIVYTHVSGATVFLDFHYPYQGYFCAVIFSSDTGKFPFSPASFYLNKEVRITGPIQLYKGSPEIIVHSPSQIEVAYMGFNYP